jgi:hypothetical protein
MLSFTITVWVHWHPQRVKEIPLYKNDIIVLSVHAYRPDFFISRINWSNSNRCFRIDNECYIDPFWRTVGLISFSFPSFASSGYQTTKASANGFYKFRVSSNLHQISSSIPKGFCPIRCVALQVWYVISSSGSSWWSYSHVMVFIFIHHNKFCPTVHLQASWTGLFLYKFSASSIQGHNPSSFSHSHTTDHSFTISDLFSQINKLDLFRYFIQFHFWIYLLIIINEPFPVADLTARCPNAPELGRFSFNLFSCHTETRLYTQVVLMVFPKKVSGTFPANQDVRHQFNYVSRLLTFSWFFQRIAAMKDWITPSRTSV